MQTDRILHSNNVVPGRCLTPGLAVLFNYLITNNFYYIFRVRMLWQHCIFIKQFTRCKDCLLWWGLSGGLIYCINNSVFVSVFIQGSLFIRRHSYKAWHKLYFHGFWTPILWTSNRDVLQWWYLGGGCDKYINTSKLFCNNDTNMISLPFGINQ